MWSLAPRAEVCQSFYQSCLKQGSSRTDGIYRFVAGRTQVVLPQWVPRLEGTLRWPQELCAPMRGAGLLEGARVTHLGGLVGGEACLWADTTRVRIRTRPGLESVHDPGSNPYTTRVRIRTSRQLVVISSGGEGRQNSSQSPLEKKKEARAWPSSRSGAGREERARRASAEAGLWQGN